MIDQKKEEEKNQKVGDRNRTGGRERNRKRMKIEQKEEEKREEGRKNRANTVELNRMRRITQSQRYDEPHSIL